MIEIKCADLREFFSRAKSIKPNGILVAQNYAILDTHEGAITKTNTNAWCIHQIAVTTKKHQKMLIDERVIGPILSSTKAETMKFTPKEKVDDLDPTKKILTVEFTDGKRKSWYGVEDTADFTKRPFDDGLTCEKTTLDETIVNAITLAAQTVLKEQAMSFGFVHVGEKGKNNEIFGSDRNIAYYRKVDQPLPTIMVGQEAAEVLSMAKEWTYYSNENYDFYDCGQTKFGFIKTVSQPVNYTPIITPFNKKSIFTVKKDDLMQYCDIAIKQSFTALVEISFSSKDKKTLNLGFSNEDYNNGLSEDIDMESNFVVPSSTFNAKMMQTLLKTFDGDTVGFSAVVANNYYIFDPEDANYIGMIVCLLPGTANTKAVRWGFHTDQNILYWLIVFFLLLAILLISK